MVFSVIVPIYNVEKYLSECIESVLNQSFADFELILVDDGSSDSCPKICDDYAKKDDRIKIIHKENGGLVSARQAGTRIAAGDYIFNLDGDDSVTADALENAYEIISRTDADIISFSYRKCVNGIIVENVFDSVGEGLYEKSDIRKEIFPKMLLDENMRHMIYFLSGKAIRRKLLTRHQLNIDTKISLGEDICCLIPCYIQANKAYISRHAAYLYNIRNDSLSNNFNTQQFIKLEYVVEFLHAFGNGVPDDFEQQIARYSCFMCFALLASSAENGHFAKLKEIKRLILNTIHAAEISRAHFKHITFKSRVAVGLMKKHCICAAFCFLYLCGKLKKIIVRKGRIRSGTNTENIDYNERI